MNIWKSKTKVMTWRSQLHFLWGIPLNDWGGCDGRGSRRERVIGRERESDRERTREIKREREREREC